jgi:hypothetical protein
VIGVRKTLAVAALFVLGGLIVTADPRTPQGGYERLAVAMWVLLVPLIITIGGIIREVYWSRWLALAAGVAVLPWATAVLIGPRYGMPALPATLAAGASLLLLSSLTGRSMFERYEARARAADWSARRMTLVRWTIVFNIASVLSLYVFVAAYDYRIDWHLAIPASLLIGLLIGVALLIHQRTVGLLLVALCCVCFVPAGAYFVWQEASYAGEAVLFVVVFLPGVLSAWATLLAFSRPIWRYLRFG